MFIYIIPCDCAFFPVFSRAFLIFFTHFVHCNIALFVVAGFLCNNNSRCAQFFALSVRFFVVLWLEGIQASSCASSSVFLSLLHIFFCYFYFTFPSIWFYTLLWHLVICLFLLFFLLSRARMLRMPFIYAWSVRGHPSHRHHSPQIFCDGHVATTPSLWPFPPHTCLPQICTAHPSITLFALFCVCYVPMHSPAPI